MRFYQGEDTLGPDLENILDQNNLESIELNLVCAHAVNWLEAEGISDAPTGLVYFLLLNLLNSVRHLFAVDRLVGKKTPNFT